MPFQHVAEQIYGRPWLITPSAYDSVVRVFESKFRSEAKFAADDGIDVSSLVVQRQPASLDVNGIGHVHIKGIVGQGLSQFQKTCGLTDTDDVQAELAALVQQGAKGILLCIDSPGGTVTGIRETADAVVNTALEIPVVVFSKSQICSSAYWIASGASRIVSTETSEIGSVGVYLPWIDRSVQWEKEGLKADPIVNTGGTYKGVGFCPSLSDAHRQNLQEMVDRIFALFSGDVIANRALNDAIVQDAALQGQVFLGLDAVEQGLVDENGSYEDAYDAVMMATEVVEPEEESSEPDATPQQESTTEPADTTDDKPTP